MRGVASLALCVALLSGLTLADQPPPFNKAELEAVLREEHSHRISNIFDGEKGIQYARQIATLAPLTTARED